MKLTSASLEQPDNIQSIKEVQISKEDLSHIARTQIRKQIRDTKPTLVDFFGGF